MHIAFLIPNLDAGGAERVLTSLANELSKTTRVSIITLVECESFYDISKNVEIKNINNITGKSLIKKIRYNLTLIFKLNGILKKEKITQLICFMPTSNIIGIIAGKFFNQIKVTISERSDPNIFRIGPREGIRRLIYKFSDTLVIQTREFKEFYQEFMPTSKIRVIANPLKLSESPPGTKEKIVLTVGRADKKKNQKQVIRSFAEVRRPGWRLVICGDGPLLNDLRIYAEDLGLRKHVEFKGIVGFIEREYERAAIFAFSSLSEGFPNVLLEAMNYHCACVSYNCPSGPSTLIKNGFNGFLIPLHDKNKFSKQLKTLI